MLTRNKYNTFWQRFFAGIIDGLVFIPLYFLEEIFIDRSKNWMFISGEVFSAVCWMLYYVIGHGKYGQTVGKRVMRIKVFALDEQTLIGYKRAFFRESVWFFATLAIILVLVIKTEKSPGNTAISATYDNMILIASCTWFALELVTMLSNLKKRAIHDFIAGSVVINLKEAGMEKTTAFK